MILVSACLLGINCKYSGENNISEKVKALMDEHVLIPVCPEQLGGLTTPRNKAEIIDGKVIDEKGNDVSLEFLRGAEEVLDIAKMYGINEAILKEGSPSCGSNFIYDGTFSGVKIEGMGLTAKLLSDNGIRVVSDENI